eukprot:sb/3463623/
MVYGRVEKCTVPMDFGRHNLEKKGLNDLQLICRGGEIVRANSFPLAMNSSVLSEIVGDQGNKELDVDRLSHSSVLCFVEACYTGTVEVTRENFREVYELSVGFQVKWIAEKFIEFYKELCLELNPESLELAVFLFEEAAYIINDRNDRDLFDTVSPMIMGFPTLRSAFIEDFVARDPNKQGEVNTKLFLSLATINEGAVLYEWLIENFELKSHPVALNKVEKRFLNLPSLTLCFQADPTVYQRLLAVVQRSLSKDDLVSVFETFGSVALSSSVRSTSTSQNSITYPIVMPALGDCTTFLEAIKVLDEEPMICSCFQFVLSLKYCCELFGDTTSPAIEDAIITAMEKRRNNTTHGLLGVAGYLDVWCIWSSNLAVKDILVQYMSTKDNVSEKRHFSEWSSVKPSRFPVQFSKRFFLSLHGYDNIYCPETPVESKKWCKVAVDVSFNITDYETWPDVTIKLVEDQAVLEAETTAHFHQDPEFLQYISVGGDNNNRNGVPDLTLCTEPNTVTPPLKEFYRSLYSGKTLDFYIRWPAVQLQDSSSTSVQQQV